MKGDGSRISVRRPDEALWETIYVVCNHMHKDIDYVLDMPMSRFVKWIVLMEKEAEQQKRQMNNGR